MSRRKIPAALVLAAALAAPSPSLATLEPLAAVAFLDSIPRTFGRVKSRWNWLRAKLGRPQARPPEMGPVLEKMRSPFADEREQGVEQMLAIAERYEGRPKAIPQAGRVEVLLGQLLRDEQWKTRYKAYQALTKVGFMEPVEDPGERFALLFPKAVPSRQGLNGTPVPAARGKTDVELLHDFMAALQTQKPAVRTKLAAVLEGLVEAGLLHRTPEPSATPAAVPPGPGLAPETLEGAPDLSGGDVIEQGLF